MEVSLPAKVYPGCKALSRLLYPGCKALSRLLYPGVGGPLTVLTRVWEDH